MRIPRLYCPTLLAGSNVLLDEEAHHAAKVLRLRRGDRVMLFNGAGGEGAGIISQARPRDFRVDVESVETRPFETRHKLTLAVALAKTHRHAYLVEKCTELGIAALWPILAERSVTKRSPSPLGRGARGEGDGPNIEPSPFPPGRGEGAAEGKLQRRAVEAAKQSHRTWVPLVAEPQPLTVAMQKIASFTAAALTDPEGTESVVSFLSRQPAGAELLVFVGPEGGFTPDEQQQLVAHGAHPVRLAPTVLRTETAAVAVCAAEAALSAS